LSRGKDSPPGPGHLPWKRRYLIEQFKLSESLFVPSSEPGKAITFSEAFPLCVTYPAPDFMPVVTFTYVDPEHRNTETSTDTSRTCVPIGLYSGSFRASSLSTFRRRRASSRRQASFFRSLWKAGASRIWLATSIPKPSGIAGNIASSQRTT
jgi:hypothetical protein